MTPDEFRQTQRGGRWYQLWLRERNPRRKEEYQRMFNEELKKINRDKGVTNMIDTNGKEFEGYINEVMLPNGKLYKLQCEVVEIYPMQCPRCGGRVELRYGSGECQSCGTAFTTQFKITEV